jgi:hypothetical protein
VSACKKNFHYLCKKCIASGCPICSIVTCMSCGESTQKNPVSACKKNFHYLCKNCITDPCEICSINCLNCNKKIINAKIVCEKSHGYCDECITSLNKCTICSLCKNCHQNISTTEDSSDHRICKPCKDKFDYCEDCKSYDPCSKCNKRSPGLRQLECNQHSVCERCSSKNIICKVCAKECDHCGIPNCDITLFSSCPHKYCRKCLRENQMSQTDFCTFCNKKNSIKNVPNSVGGVSSEYYQ